jgi:hypothetical protein
LWYVIQKRSFILALLHGDRLADLVALLAAPLVVDVLDPCAAARTDVAEVAHRHIPTSSISTTTTANTVTGIAPETAVF